MSLRAFRASILFAIDESESPDFDGGDDTTQPPASSFTQIKKWLKDAMILEVNTEDKGDPYGFQSSEIVFDSMEELHPDTVKKLYDKNKHGYADEEVIGLEKDGTVIQWNAATGKPENTGESLDEYGYNNLRRHEIQRLLNSKVGLTETDIKMLTS